MNYGLYQSAGGVLSNLHEFQVISNNLANTQTTGFKADLALAQQRLPERLESGTPVDPQLLLERLGGGQLATPTMIEFIQGSLAQTGSSTDVAIDGKGLFVVGPERGATEESSALTRDGRFSLNADNQLVMSATGWNLLDDRNQPIELDQGAFEIDENGTIHQGGEEVATIAMRRVEHPDALEKLGDGLLRATSESGPATADTTSTVRQGYLEDSTVNPIIAMKDLMELSRALEANVRMMQYQDLLMGQAAGTLGKVT
ncbi:MAG: hypothetical protein CMJ24_10665 [Phycisphaerae bacterium]|jgi:flagellar basal body rod protein FlgG|nr:hypothetical protein [Phycisphaerae bacterium]|tara:strand:- start:15137 stop:15910 length:774 start_codon:yes stop_codon:yes gene_type:complete